jgi:hypothetical protein
MKYLLLQGEPFNGIKSGALSFSIPGIDVPVKGTWMVVPEGSDTVNKLRAAS